MPDPSQDTTAPREKIWSCKIGGITLDELPDGCDLPMRQAVKAAFHAITGEWPDFTFSGWGDDLTEDEREVVSTHQARLKAVESPDAV